MDQSSASVGELVAEHRTIGNALMALAREIERAKVKPDIDVAHIKEICAFSQSFVDRCHHGKEEGCFFPCLEKRGVPREGSPIAIMLEEHERGRGLVARISAALVAYEKGLVGASSVVGPCQEYYDLLTQHILKEEGILFQIGARLMEGNDDEETAECFELKEQSVGRKEHERLTAWAKAHGGNGGTG